MDGVDAIDFAREAIWLVLALSAPVLITGLIAGVVIAMLQALTQIQDITLTLAPKIIASFVALLIFLPLMGAMLSDFMGSAMDRIAGL